MTNTTTPSLSDRIIQTATVAKYEHVRPIIAMSARVTQVALCSFALYAALGTFGALFSGGALLKSGITFASGVLKIFASYDLIRITGNFASIFEVGHNGADYPVRKMIGEIIENTSSEDSNFLGYLAQESGLDRFTSASVARELTKDTLILYNLNPYIAKVLNQRI